MASLADLRELAGFFSYSQEDDEQSAGTLHRLRSHIRTELGAQLGRSNRDFRLWQDKALIGPGQESIVTEAVKQSVFFIPIITPRFITSGLHPVPKTPS